MNKSRLTLRVRYAETDRMGVAHHASSFTWMETARTELLRERGLPYRKLDESGYYLPVCLHKQKRQSGAGTRFLQDALRERRYYRQLGTLTDTITLCPPVPEEVRQRKTVF